MTLIDASSDTEVQDVACGSTISKSEVGVNSFSLHANFENVGSVVFESTGAVEYSQTENMYPYALFGGSATNYNGQSFVNGRYRVTATAYSDSGGSGEIVGQVTIVFHVVD
jgi:hypothetical protein